MSKRKIYYFDNNATTRVAPEVVEAMLPFLTTGLVTASLDNPNTDSARITVTITNYPFNFISGFMSQSTWYKTIIATEPYEVVN